MKTTNSLSCYSCPERCCWLSPDEPMQLTCRKHKKNITFIIDLDEALAKTICVCKLPKPVQLNIGFEYEDE